MQLIDRAKSVFNQPRTWDNLKTLEGLLQESNRTDSVENSRKIGWLIESFYRGLVDGVTIFTADASDNPLLNIIDRADKTLNGLEEGAIARINTALESAYQSLESQLLQLYSQENSGSLLARQRAAVLLNQVGDLLTLLNTRNAQDIQEALEGLLRASTEQGQTLAQELTQAVTDQRLQMTAQIPLEAIRNQATEGMQRLRNHTEHFADKASTVVVQGLTQGWSSDAIARVLRDELGIVKFRAEAIARTESLSASNRAAESTYQANGIRYVQLMSTLDDRTCPYCVSRTLNVYELGKISVPLHVNCRCFLMSWSPEWSQLGLTNDEWAGKFKSDLIAELKSNGLEPNPGLAPFEKANGLDLPTPVWIPGQKLDSDEWREDKLCGKSAIPNNRNCKKGVSPQHPASNPSNKNHAAWKAAIAAQAKDKNHPAHAESKAALKGAKGGGSPVVTGSQAENAPTTPAKKASAKKSTKKTTGASGQSNTGGSTGKNAPQKAIVANTSPKMFDALDAMAKGLEPDKVKLNPTQEKLAQTWLEMTESAQGKGKDKISKIQAQNPNISTLEAHALAAWLGGGYTEMSEQIWKKQAGVKFDESPMILAASVLAAKALHKLPKQNVDDWNKRADQWSFQKEKNDLSAQWNRWMKIDEGALDGFLKKYQDAVGKPEYTEGNFMGISHLSPENMKYFSRNASVLYRIKPKLDGTSQGRYVDDFKNSNKEGEVLYPPGTKFKVNRVEQMKTPSNPQSIPQMESTLAMQKGVISLLTKLEKGKKLNPIEQDAIEDYFLEEKTALEFYDMNDDDLKAQKPVIKAQYNDLKKKLTKAKKKGVEPLSPEWNKLYNPKSWIIELEEI